MLRENNLGVLHAVVSAWIEEDVSRAFGGTGVITATLKRGLGSASLPVNMRTRMCQQVHAKMERVHLENRAANTPPETAVKRRALPEQFA